CWGFLLLGSPMMIAYGINANVAAWFYGLALLYFLAFALFPCCVGAAICLAVTNCLPRRTKEVLVALGAAALVFGLYYGIRAWQLAQGSVLTRGWVNSLLRQVRLANLPL